MRAIAPRLVVDDTREPLPEITIAEDQLEYIPVTAAIVGFSDDTVGRILRYTFTKEERERIAMGADLFFGTFASIPLQPHWFSVGPPEGTDLEK